MPSKRKQKLPTTYIKHVAGILDEFLARIEEVQDEEDNLKHDIRVLGPMESVLSALYEAGDKLDTIVDDLERNP
jgi:hypothetical protein